MTQQTPVEIALDILNKAKREGTMTDQALADIALDILNGYADVVGQTAETLATQAAKLYEARDAFKSIIPTIKDALPKA